MYCYRTNDLLRQILIVELAHDLARNEKMHLLEAHPRIVTPSSVRM